MKRTLISFAVASVLGLTACSQDPGTSDDGLSASSQSSSESAIDSSQTAAKAELRLTVNFPGANRAQAALIDENAGLIAVRIRRTAAVTIEEYEQVVNLCRASDAGGYDQYGNYNGTGDYDYMGNYVGLNLTQDEAALCELAQDQAEGNNSARTVTTVVLDPVNNSATVEVPVGKYEIYAAQYANQLDLVDERRISGAKSFAELTEGSHSVLLSMTHGTWDLVDNVGAPTTIDFQLLNNTAVLTELGFPDADPSVAANQTPAEALGLNGGELSGFHLADWRYYTRVFGAPDIPTQNNDYDDDFSFKQFLPWIVTIPRLVDTAGVETDVIPRNEYYDNCCDPDTGEWFQDSTEYFSISMEPGFHLQQYDGTQNSNEISFSDYWLDIENYETGLYFSSGIFLKTTFDFLTAPTDDGSNWVYDEGDSDNYVDINNRTFTAVDGTTQTLVIAGISTEGGSFTHPNTDAPLTDYPDAMTADGSTITGTLIEVVESRERIASSVVTAPVYAGAAPTLPAAGKKAYKAYRLDQAAISLGLKATTASSSAFGENCIVAQDNWGWYYNEFAWDEGSSQWIPGTWNWSYYYDTFNGVSGEDLDSDGVVEPFEQAFYNNLIQQADYDDINSVYTGNAKEYGSYVTATDTWTDFFATTEYVCVDVSGDVTCSDQGTPVTDGEFYIDPANISIADLDGNGFIQQYEGALVQENESGTIHACMHEFTLKGRQLDIAITPADTTVVVD